MYLLYKSAYSDSGLSLDFLTSGLNQTLEILIDFVEKDI